MMTTGKVTKERWVDILPQSSLIQLDKHLLVQRDKARCGDTREETQQDQDIRPSGGQDRDLLSRKWLLQEAREGMYLVLESLCGVSV